MPALPPFGFRSRQPWSLQNLLIGKYLHFSALADLCKEMSTKSNDNAAAAGGGWPPSRGGKLPSYNRFLTSFGLGRAHFRGLPWLKGRAAGGGRGGFRVGEAAAPPRAGL